jgi:hypothetical protein
MLNYHEFDRHLPRDSPVRRQQFLVICTIMAGTFAYATIMAGILNSVKITEGKFPGGDFVYKSAKRDYAAAPSLELEVGENLGFSPEEHDDRIYTIFLDHPGQVANGRDQRFASGFLSKSKSDRALKDKLIAMNPNIQPPSKAELSDLGAAELWTRLRYKQKSLPAVKAAVVHFPFTNGFVSSLMHSWRIVPVLRKHATEKLKEAGSKSPSVTVITTCSVKDQMCTHYAPLEKGDVFLLGQPRMETYLESLSGSSMFDFGGLHKMIKKIARFIGVGKNATTEEL